MGHLVQHMHDNICTQNKSLHAYMILAFSHLTKNHVFIVFMAIFTLVGRSSSAQSSLSSRHFKLEKLTEGVYAAVASIDGHAICNAGIIDLGDAAMIVDPFMTPEAAEDLRMAARELTGQTVYYVVNTHFHNDHTGGNQVFKEAVIISTERARKAMQEGLPEELEYNKEHAAARVAKFNGYDTSQMNAEELEEHNMMKSYYEALASSVPTLKLTYPGLSFTDSLWIHGSNRSVLLKSCGNAHSPGDLMVELPNDGILFTGDVLFVGYHPWLGDGDIEQWDQLLEWIQKQNYAVLVPGHGRIGSKEDLQPLRNYMKDIKIIAQRYRGEGRPPQSDNTLKVPQDYAKWKLSGFFKPNVYGVWERAGK